MTSPSGSTSTGAPEEFDGRRSLTGGSAAPRLCAKIKLIGGETNKPSRPQLAFAYSVGNPGDNARLWQ